MKTATKHTIYSFLFALILYISISIPINSLSKFSEAFNIIGNITYFDIITFTLAFFLLITSKRYKFNTFIIIFSWGLFIVFGLMKGIPIYGKESISDSMYYIRGFLFFLIASLIPLDNFDFDNFNSKIVKAMNLYYFIMILIFLYDYYNTTLFNRFGSSTNVLMLYTVTFAIYKIRTSKNGTFSDYFHIVISTIMIALSGNLTITLLIVWCIMSSLLLIKTNKNITLKKTISFLLIMFIIFSSTYIMLNSDNSLSRRINGIFEGDSLTIVSLEYRLITIDYNTEILKADYLGQGFGYRLYQFDNYGNIIDHNFFIEFAYLLIAIKGGIYLLTIYILLLFSVILIFFKKIYYFRNDYTIKNRYIFILISYSAILIASTVTTSNIINSTSVSFVAFTVLGLIYRKALFIEN